MAFSVLNLNGSTGLAEVTKLANRVNSDINLKSAIFTPCKFQKYIKFYAQRKFCRQKLLYLCAENLRYAGYLLTRNVKFRRFDLYAVERAKRGFG